MIAIPSAASITNSRSRYWKEPCQRSRQTAGSPISPPLMTVMIGPDPAVWVKASRSLGVTVKVDDLKRQIDEAKEMPAQQNAIRRLRLNEWTEQVTRWLDMSVWEECGPPA